MNKKNIKHLVALGYPIGILPTDEATHYKIENSGDIYGIPTLDYVVWQLAFAMENTQEAKRKFIEITKESEDTFFSIGEKLMRNKLIIELDLTNLENEMNKLYELSFVRQGVGRGLIFDENNEEKYHVINIDGDVELNQMEYLLWVRGDGKTPIYKMVKEIMDNNKDESERKKILEVICKSLLILYRKNLIIFKR